MFATAQKATKALISKTLPENYDSSAFSSQSLPENYSLRQLYDDLAASDRDSSKEDELANLLILDKSLSESTRLRRNDRDDEFIDKLALWISQTILPIEDVMSQDEMPEDDDSPQRQKAITLARQEATLGLKAISTLIHLRSPGQPPALDLQILLSLIAHISPRDPWTTPPTISLSNTILSTQTQQTHTPSFIVTYLLQTIIRPLFSASKPTAITSTGRKAMPSSLPPKSFDTAELDRSSRPWKCSAPYSVTVFQWAVENASKEIVQQSWNLFIPPLLTLLDDSSNSIRVRGLLCLKAFLPKLNSKLLAQTGLGEVFEDAVTPTLLFLPSLTPLEESLQLLPAAYYALFVLADVRFTDDEAGHSSRLKLYDRIMRKGVLTAYLHSNDSPAIVEILVTQISRILSKMGIHSVKYLKDILPILTTVLTGPFGPAMPSLLLGGMKTLQAVILNCWPRIALEKGHRMEVVKMLVLSWKNLSEGEEDGKEKGLGEVKEELKVAGRLLVKAVEEEVDFRAELMPLFEADPGLVEVFGMDHERIES